MPRLTLPNPEGLACPSCVVTPMSFDASDLLVTGQPEIRMLAGRFPSSVHEYQQ